MNKKYFVIGKYYKYNAEYGIHIFKLKEIKGSFLFFDLNHYIYNDDIFFFSENDYYANVYYDSLYENYYREIDIKDIIDLLPSNNPDKINYIRKQRVKMLLM